MSEVPLQVPRLLLSGPSQVIHERERKRERERERERERQRERDRNDQVLSAAGPRSDLAGPHVPPALGI